MNDQNRISQNPIFARDKTAKSMSWMNLWMRIVFLQELNCLDMESLFVFSSSVGVLEKGKQNESLETYGILSKYYLYLFQFSKPKNK